MRFDPQANYVPADGPAISSVSLGRGPRRRPSVGTVLKRLVAVLMVGALGGAGIWFWTQSAQGTTSDISSGADDPIVLWSSPDEADGDEVAALPSREELVAWNRNEEARKAYRAGLSAASMGRHVDAVPHFSEAVILDPDFAEGHYRLGLAYVRTGNLEGARDEREALDALDPSLARLLGSLIP